jgi:hypothetical protein
VQFTGEVVPLLPLPDRDEPLLPLPDPDEPLEYPPTAEYPVAKESAQPDMARMMMEKKTMAMRTMNSQDGR